MIPIEIAKLNRFVGATDSKIPIDVKTGKAASSTNPATWSDFNSCVRALKQGKIKHIGFVFNGDGIVGIDIDKGFDSEGFLSDLSVDCINACKSYTEYSKSKRGVHILVRGKLPFKGANNRDGIEIYSADRYFICTGNPILNVNVVENQEAIDYIVQKYFADTPAPTEKSERKPTIYTPKTVFENGVLKTEYPVMEEGSRHINMLSYAGQLLSRYPLKEVRKKVFECNEKVCNPPLPESELNNILKSIEKYQARV